MSLKLSDASYKLVLVRLRDQIANGLPLKAEDSTEPGNKYTECNWGLCSEEKEAWPDAADHLWPDQFLKNGRVAPKYRKDTHLCPMDTREPSDRKEKLMIGCFYTCKVFRHGNPRPTREQAIEWYDKRIAQSIAKEST